MKVFESLINLFAKDVYLSGGKATSTIYRIRVIGIVIGGLMDRFSGLIHVYILRSRIVSCRELSHRALLRLEYRGNSRILEDLATCVFSVSRELAVTLRS